MSNRNWNFVTYVTPNEKRVVDQQIRSEATEMDQTQLYKYSFRLISTLATSQGMFGQIFVLFANTQKYYLYLWLLDSEKDKIHEQLAVARLAFDRQREIDSLIREKAILENEHAIAVAVQRTQGKRTLLELYRDYLTLEFAEKFEEYCTTLAKGRSKYLEKILTCFWYKFELMKMLRNKLDDLHGKLAVGERRLRWTCRDEVWSVVKRNTHYADERQD